MEGQLKNGTILTSESGNKYTVVNLLGAGGQGEVYDVECDGKHYALKWYFKGSATARQKKLLEEIIAKGAPDSSFLWPMELIVPSQGNLFGYIMPLRPKNYKSIVDLMKNRVNPSFYVICRTAFNLTKGYRNLHIAGAKYQDISFGNLFFNPDNGDVLICDNDNVSYGNSKPGGVLGTPGFMAPEIVRGEARPSRDTDRYSLAVLLFYLFMVNHPLEGKQEASIKCMDMAARVKLYGTDPIFIFDPDNKTNRPVPGIHDNANIYWPLYPEQLRQLFIKSFTVGLNNPSKRVTEPEWMNLFANMMSGLMKCTCGASVFFDESLEANGVTEMGKAFELLAAQLSIPPMPTRALPPVIVLLSDGQPTDSYKDGLNKLKALPWFKKAVKIAISIGSDADDDVLEDFAGNKELILQANNAAALAKMIKWASTTASMVSAPASKPMNADAVSTPAGSGDPFAPANGGAPLVIDMSNIPSPDDFDDGAIW